MTPFLPLSKALSIAAFVCLLVSLGCGEKPNVVQTELVEGLVTLDGQPLPGATVTFTPVQEGSGVPAAGLTDESGKYRLTAMALGGGKKAEPGTGTLPGDYYVGVVKDETPSVPGSKDPGYDSLKAADRTPTEVKHIVPQKFNDPQNSGIKVTVKAGKNDIPIPLQSK